MLDADGEVVCERGLESKRVYCRSCYCCYSLLLPGAVLLHSHLATSLPCMGVAVFVDREKDAPFEVISLEEPIKACGGVLSGLYVSTEGVR